MPSESKVSRLLRRLSSKNLHKRAKSQTDDNSFTGEEEFPRTHSEPPPLPSKADVTRGFQMVTLASGLEKPHIFYQSPSGSTASISDYGEQVVKPHDSVYVPAFPSLPAPPSRPASRATKSTPEIRKVTERKKLEEYPKPPESKIDPEAQSSDTMTAALNAVTKANVATKSKSSKGSKMLQQIETNYGAAIKAQTNNAVIISTVQAGITAVGGVEAIQTGLNSFMEHATVIMKTLDEVSKLHPFIGVAVLAFKAVIGLEMKRRANDQKITALHVEMTDMMAVLCQLKDVKDVDGVAPNGMPLKARLQQLSEATGNDIVACANTCDTYTKKTLLVKVLNGPVWEGKLATYATVFTKRREEFEFALTMHIARGVDDANDSLKRIEKSNEDLTAKMDAMLQLYQHLATAEHKKLAAIIEQKGGAEACQHDENLLLELSKLESNNDVASTAPQKNRSSSAVGDILDELHADPDEAIKNNMEVFTRKFEIQKRQIIQETERIVRREGDRIINAITSGPHDKIIDPNIYKIWKEMRWPNSVKTRNFIMAFHDYYHEKSAALRQSSIDQGMNQSGQPSIIPVSAIPREDEKWALEFIDVVRLQPISEAFDDDGSGFITVNEVNTFTTLRPLGWSLPQWIAYWAVGWNMTLRGYQEKIRELIGKMFAILPSIPPENQTSVNEYINKIYVSTATIYESVHPCIVNHRLQSRFQSYVEMEEHRLRLNLESIRYDIDGSETLELVTGPGRIERFVLPLLYLILQRHFEILRVARTRVLHEDEAWDAADTIHWITDALNERVKTLTLIFRQQKLEPEQQFKSFAHGLFESCYDSKLMWSPSRLRASHPPDYPYNEEFEDKSIKAEDVCNYELDHQLIDYGAYDPICPHARPTATGNISDLLKPVLGQWTGTVYDGFISTTGLISFILEPQDLHGATPGFKASGRANRSDFTISGRCKRDESSGALRIWFKQQFPTRFPTMFWRGQVDLEKATITGKVRFTDNKKEKTFFQFILKRLPCEIMRFRPLPPVFDQNKARALWIFATSAVISQIRRYSWSWSSYFKERQNTRKRFIELYIREMHIGKPLNGGEISELGQLRHGLTVADGRFYYSLALHQVRLITLHDIDCEACGGQIGGARIFCLDCTSDDTWDSVDLCDNETCLKAEIRRSHLPRPHRPTHDFVKVRRVVHLPYIGQLERSARAALTKSRNIFALPMNNGISIGKGAPVCIFCNTQVNQPCWYCIQCGGRSFICNACDSLGDSAFKKYQYKGDHDFKLHDLVRCTAEVEEDTGVSLEDKLDQLEMRFKDHKHSMEERLTRIEELLQQLVSKRSKEA